MRNRAMVAHQLELSFRIVDEGHLKLAGAQQGMRE